MFLSKYKFIEIFVFVILTFNITAFATRALALAIRPIRTKVYLHKLTGIQD